MGIWLGEGLVAVVQEVAGRRRVLIGGPPQSGDDPIKPLVVMDAEQLRIALAVAEGRDPDPKQQLVRVLRVLEYVGTKEWIDHTLMAKGALIPGGNGQWGGATQHISSTLLPEQFLSHDVITPARPLWEEE